MVIIACQQNRHVIRTRAFGFGVSSHLPKLSRLKNNNIICDIKHDYISQVYAPVLCTRRSVLDEISTHSENTSA